MEKEKHILEQAIDYLLEVHEIEIKEVIEKTGIDRNTLYNIRRLNNNKRKQETFETIKSYFAQLNDFVGYSSKKPKTENSSDEYKDKYIKILEENNNDLKEEIKSLRAKYDSLMNLLETRLKS
jgi:hypothetical protein